jgi:hypothetical protein
VDIAEFIAKYGFPVVAAFGLMGLLWYVWNWVTKEVKPVISEASSTLIELIDRVRILDNDMIRLNQKLETYISLKHRLKVENQVYHETEDRDNKKK